MLELEASGSGRRGAGGAGGGIKYSCAQSTKCTCLMCIATPSGEQLLHELSTDAGSLDHVSLGHCEYDIFKQLLLRMQQRGVILFIVHNHHISLLGSSGFDLEHNKWKSKNRQVE